MEGYIRLHHGKSKAFARVRRWLLGLFTPAFAVCLAVGLFLICPLTSAITSYADDTANPLINSNIGKHSEWYYGFGSSPVTKNDTTGGYAGWYAQLGLDNVTVEENGQEIKQNSARPHKLVQASSSKEGTTDKVFIINSPEEAAKVWTEAVEYALGQSEDSPYKTTVDQSKDPISGEVQKIPGGGIARGNYFADSYTVENVNGSKQTSYKGQYITVKLNCDWYAKDIETNIAFALGNVKTAPKDQVITHDKRWITTFNWAKDYKTFESYWLGTNNWAEEDTSRKDIREDYSESEQVFQVPGENGTANDRQLSKFTGNGDGYTNDKGYYASYDLATMADQTANAEGQVGFNISSPFSYGRINVPTGAYIVLDLNGHTISRGLTEENNEEISYHGSILKSKYEYNLGAMDELNKLVQIYDGTLLGARDGGNLYGNELCYYGSVMTVQPKARLEIVDSSAYERASDGRITKLNKDNKNVDLAETVDKTVTHYETNHKGTISGGCTNERYYVYMDNDLGVENGATFGYNSNEGKGGAVHVNPSGELIVHSGTFKDNQAQYGGAFYALSRAAVLVYNGYFINNYATIRGGATYVASKSRSVFTFYDGVISYNRAADAGGGVFLCDNAYVNLHGGYITHNQAGNQGGGVYIGENGEGLLENVNITQNVAGTNGGGIYVHAKSKFKFAGSLIVTQNYGDCGTYTTSNAGGTGDKGNGLDTRAPYILRLTVKGEPVRACGWNTDGNGDYQSTYDVTLSDSYGLTSGYTKTSEKPGEKCPHGGVHNAPGTMEPDGKTNTPPDYPMWSLGDAFNKEYNRLGGVVWKHVKSNVDGRKTYGGSVTEIAEDGSANNVYLENGATIIIDGPLFRNGIGAQIGVTMAGSGNFTSNYNEHEKVNPWLYFTSDDTTDGKGVVWDNDRTKTEAKLGTATSPTDLTWEITGYLYGKKDEPITIEASGDEEKTFKWSVQSPSYNPKGSNPDAEINSFKWTGKTMLFDHKMFEVTKVVAKAGGETKATWTIDKLKATEDDGSSHTAGVDYTLHYLLAAQGEENEATDGRLVYAGDYSFRVIDKNATVYSNATFTIHINQLGVGVSAYEVKNGETTWKDKENIFKDNATPGEDKIKEYLAGALYYRGTAYDFVLDSRFITTEGPDKGKVKDSAGNVSAEKFTGAVMKFTYANKDFFGADVEIDFGKVDFDLEYYWRELGDSTQKELEKTNYFLHAGFYEVRGAHEVVGKGPAPSVDYMKNNIAFQSEMHLPIQRVSVSVWLEDNATVREIDEKKVYGYTFKDGVYTTKQILYFNNNDEAGNDPELDKNVVVNYYTFDYYVAHSDNLDVNEAVGIKDNSDGTERWGVKDAGKYVVHVSLNTKMWNENAPDKDNPFTERGKPYNDYIFTSKDLQRMAEKVTKDEQGRDVAYEFAYYFFISPVEIEHWTNEQVPEEGQGSINLDDRTYDATNAEPNITGRYSAGGANRGLYNYPEMPDEKVVQVRYLSKKDHPANADGSAPDDIKVTADGIEQPDNSKWAIWETETKYEGTDENGNPILKSKFQPIDAGEYWILVYFRGVMPIEGNEGAEASATKYVPVTNFKGVYIGTYTIKPVEITVSGSLSYTYDGSSFERARYLPPRVGQGDDDAWYESIFFLVQDNITTPNELITNQHAVSYTTEEYAPYAGATETKARTLRDLWGGNNIYYDAAFYKGRYTLGNVSVTYSSEEFKQHDISLGIGLYSFNTGKADVGTYHLSTVEYDKKGNTKDDDDGGTTTAPSEGVTWLISYEQADGKQVQKFNTDLNFKITSESWFNVTVDQKDLSELYGDITKVGEKDYHHYADTSGSGTTITSDGKTENSYPFAGTAWKYEPDVTINYQPVSKAKTVVTTTVADWTREHGSAPTPETREVKSFACGRNGVICNITTTIEVDDENVTTTTETTFYYPSATGRLTLTTGKDYSIQYTNNTNATTDALITLQGTGNYKNSLQLIFKITPARIYIDYDGIPAQYDANPHAVTVTYENIETYSDEITAFIKPTRAGSVDTWRDEPVPNASALYVRYAKCTATDSSSTFGNYDDNAPVDAGLYSVQVTLGNNDFQFVGEKVGAESPFTPGAAGEDGYVHQATGTHTVIPAVVTFAVTNSGGDTIYNRAQHAAALSFTNATYQWLETNSYTVPSSLKYVVPEASNYTVSYEPANGEEATNAPVDANTYKLTVELTSGNYCFAVTVLTGTTGKQEGYSCVGSATSGTAQSYTYNFMATKGSETESTEISDSFTPGAFVINKATITLDRFADSVYNRTAQPQTPAFSNTQSNNEAVPTLKDGNNVGVEVEANEYTITYKDENIISKTDSCINSVPYHSELYSIKIELIEAGAKNFEFRTKPIPAPSFTRKNITAAENLLMQRYGEKGKEKDSSVITAPFLINPAQITFSLAESSFNYNAEEHKPTIENGGINLTNTQNEGVLPTLATGEAPTCTEVAVSYSYSGWAKDHAGFTNVGNYTVTLTLPETGDFQFADGNYTISREYTIVALDISLAENFSAVEFTQDKEHQDYNVAAYHYTGKEIQPEITIKLIAKSNDISKYNNITLKTTDESNIGLRVAYTDNVNAGPATATLTGINNFTGTRVETFYVLPAIVSITASDGNSHSETFNPNAKTFDNGSLAFSYNKTAQVLTHTFKNLCTTEGNEDTAPLPNNADYVVEYYNATDWDSENNKPKKNATPLANGVVDAGEYFVWFHFVSGGKHFSNFVFYKEDPKATDINGMFDKNEPFLFSYKFKVVVTPAEIQLHLPDPFKGKNEKGADCFINSFVYDRTNRRTALSNVIITNDDNILPSSATDYTVTFKGADEAGALSDVTNVGTYYLVFKLSAANNFNVTGIYAGSDKTVALESVDKDGKGYCGSMEDFSVMFTITPARIEVYLSEDFRSGTNFINSFYYNKTEWVTTLGSVQFKNELRNGIIPQSGEYSRSFKSVVEEKESIVTSVKNVGSYKLVISLTGEVSKNFVIIAVYAGIPDVEGSTPVKLKNDSATGYEKLDSGDDMRSLSVAFTITPAQIDLYLNAFLNGEAFTNQFVYDGTDQSIKLGSIELKNDANIIPASQAYTVTFFYDYDGHRDETENVGIYDVGKYTLLFQFTDEAGKNYVLRDIYAGSTTGSNISLKDKDDKGNVQYRGKTDYKVYVDFEVTPAKINVFFSASDLKGNGEFVNEFYYNRGDWTARFGSIYLVAEKGAVPQGSQFSIEYYSLTLVDGTQKWTDSPVTTIVDVGRYAVTFRLSNELTNHYPDAKHYKNYTIVNVYAGGSTEGDSVKLDPTVAPNKDGYRTSSDPKNDVYITLVFDIMPNVVQLSEVSDVIFNDDAQDAGFSFTFADKQGAVLPELGSSDFSSLVYTIDATNKTGNERLKNGKPYFAGAYTVTMGLSNNFVFETKDGTRSATKNFRVTPVVLSAYLGDKDGSEIKEGNSLTYDRQSHEYKIYTRSTAAAVELKEDANVHHKEDANVHQVQTAAYNGWNGTTIDKSEGYKNAGAYTVTLTFYILGTEIPGGNFSFGNNNYTMSITYTIQQRTITDDDVYGIENNEHKVYNGKPQTNGIVVRMALVEGAEKTELKQYDAELKKGDYSISNTSDINVGYVTNIVTGMQNFQGTVNLSYYIDPANVTAVIDKTSLPYNAQDQSRSFTFVNVSNTGVLPAYNPSESVSDYIVTYALGGTAIDKLPHNAGVYTVTVKLQNSTGIEGNQPNFKFAEDLNGWVDDYTATFTFEITKAKIYLDVISDASYTGDPLPAKIGFVNAVNATVLPEHDTVITYDGLNTAPTHVKTNGNRTPIPYLVKVTLTDLDLDNFAFVAHEDSKTYSFDKVGGTWGQEAYKITPALITGSLSVTIDDVAKDTTSNVYDAKKHVLDVVFRNFEAGINVLPVGKKGDAAINGLAATYNVTADDETLLYTLKVTFTPNYAGFNTMPFDGIPENAGAYAVAVKLVSADFSFAQNTAEAEWTYTITNAPIGAAESLGTASEGSTTFVSKKKYVYVPNQTNDITVTAEDFVFIDKADGFNAENATFTYTSCAGLGDYVPLTNGNGLTIGYTLTGAGDYVISITVDAPNHERLAIKLKVTVDATQITLKVQDAHFNAVYGETEAYSPENVLATVLQFIRDGKILVEGISGDAAKQAEALQQYGFGIRILTDSGDYSGAHLLKAGGYGLEIDAMKVSGFSGGSFVVFKGVEGDSTKYEGTVFTVTPLAIEVATKDGIQDLRYNGNSLVNEAASYVYISNLFDGDNVFFASVQQHFSEGGNFNNGSVFDITDVVDVGNYWVHVFSGEGTNGLLGSDCGNYMIETKDENSQTIRYAGENGVYVAFEIKRRTVELALAESSSVYGDDAAVYGEEGAKAFSFSYVDNVLTNDFGSGDKAEQLRKFVLGLLALFNGDGTAKLDRSTTPYPGAGSYIVKLDSEAGTTAEGLADWALGDGKFCFDKNYILHIDGAQSGKHTVTKRAMRVTLHDYSSYYGDDLKEEGFEGSEGAWGFTAQKDQFVGDDSEKDLGIVITRDGTAFTNQGTFSGHWWSAMTYVGGLTAVYSSDNYDVTFVEGSGNYIILPRPIIVLIGSQTSVYGEPILKDLSGLPNNWEVYGTTGAENMGYAGGESRATLKITLTVDGVINQNAAAGVYPDVIKGSCGNSNYAVTFRNWVTEDGKNEPGEHDGGDYVITKRSVAIRIGTAEAVYGTDGLHVGAQINLTAPIYSGESKQPTNAAQAQWTYDFDKADYTILQEHLGYLTFYLGKAEPANPETLYAQAGKHAIVGRWGLNYDDAMIFMKSYDVKFYGAWESEKGDPNNGTAGTYTIKPADIMQRPDSNWTKSCVYRMWPEDGDKSPDTGWYAMEILADYLVYAGDYASASHGKLTFSAERSDETKLVYLVEVDGVVRATITYSKPTNTTEVRQEVENVGNLWTIHSVGIWEMEITVEADNHNTATFTLTYYINSVTAKVMLNTSIAPMEAEYGEYDYIELALGEADYSKVYDEQLKDLPLTSALHDYLAKSIMGVDGLSEAYPGTNTLDWINMILDNCWVEVIDAKISSSGKLQAGSYHLRIVAQSGCGFVVAFMDGVPDDGKVDFSGYDRLIIDRKEVGIDWVSEEKLGTYETMPEVAERVTYTYSSYNYHFKPLFTEVLAGDFVDDPQARFYNDKSVMCTPHDVGSYRITVEKLLTGTDAGNYKLPEQLEIGLDIVKMEVVVTLRDEAITYGESHPDLLSLGVVLNGAVEETTGAAWYCDKLGVNDSISALALQIDILDAAGVSIERQSDAGIYRIVGSSESKNYHVTFRSETDSEKTEAVYTIYRSNVTFAIDSLTETYGRTQGQFTYRMTEGLLAPWDAQSSAVGVSLSADCGEKCNVDSYAICGTWTNKNYNVRFTGDWKGELPDGYLQQDELGNPTKEPQGAGTYTIIPLEVHLTMQSTMESVYGDYSVDPDMGVPTFYEFALSTVKPVTGYDYAYKETVADLKLTWTLPKANDVGVYTIKAEEVENEDPNYDITFDNVLVWTVTPRTVTITVHTQHSTYGDAFVELDGSDLAFWEAENLAPWDMADPYAALGIQLSYNEKTIAVQANVGIYKNAIEANPTRNINNYTFVYHNEDGEIVQGGTYEVERREVTIKVHTQYSTYGDVIEELDGSNLTLWEAENLAPWHTSDPYAALGIQLKYDPEVLDITQAHAGTYLNAIKAIPTQNTDNYTFIYQYGTHEVARREVTIKVHTQSSTYGDVIEELDGSDLTLWEAENLAPWHTADPYKALGIQLKYDPEVLDITQAHAGTYLNAIKAIPTQNTDNYTFVYQYGTHEVERREVTIKVHTQSSTYGDVIEELDGSDLTLWKAENLAPWHTADPYAALGIELEYDPEIIDINHADAGTYLNAIKAIPTQNTDNYTFVYQYGTHEVARREVTIKVHKQSSTYGDVIEELDGSDLTLWEAENLAPWHTADPYAALGIQLKYDPEVLDITQAHAGTYLNAIKAIPTQNTDNYTFIYQYGTHEVEKAKNYWITQFSLESMNEGDTPDETLLSASARFGTATVKYYYDESCLQEVTGELSTLPKNTYYAKITVDGTDDYTELKEIKAFVVNESFLVVNGALDVTLYVCIYASQFIILTFALIFLRRKKADEQVAEEMK